MKTKLELKAFVLSSEGEVEVVVTSKYFDLDNATLDEFIEFLKSELVIQLIDKLHIEHQI